MNRRKFLAGSCAAGAVLAFPVPVQALVMPDWRAYQVQIDLEQSGRDTSAFFACRNKTGSRFCNRL